MASTWRAEERDERGVRVLELHGELDLSIAPELERLVTAAMSRSEESVCVDLTDVSYLDSSSVRALLRAAAAAQEEGKSVRVIGASGITRRVLELTGVDELLGLDQSE